MAAKGDKAKERPRSLRILLATLMVGFKTLKVILFLVWAAYQLALGAALVGLAYGVYRVGEYIYVWDILELPKEKPKSTAFIDAERARLTDSVRAAGQWPPPDTLIRWNWIPLDSIPKTIQELALIAEDAKFYEHQGFDLEQIEYALVANHQAGKKARGASTITQQVAKNLYLTKDKEMSRKAREAVITLLMEQFVPKDRILETYLNIAQFGEGVFGVREGARYWMKKELRDLTQEESVNLVCLLPSPTKWSPKKPNNAYLQHKRLVLRNFAMYKGLKAAGDSTQLTWQDSALIKLADQLSEDRWKLLRSRPMLDSGAEGAEGDSGKGNWIPGFPAGPEATNGRPRGPRTTF